MDLLGTVRGAITWLGGAIAGLTVLCYGAGYFALHTYLGMLGLDGIVPVKPDQMLVEGAEFWRWLIYKLILYLGLVVILGMILFTAVEHLRPLRRIAESAGSASLRVWKLATDRFPRIGSLLILLFFLVALEIHSYSFDAIRGLSISPPQLLFDDQGASKYSKLVATVDPDRLPRSYFILILLVFLAFGKVLEGHITTRASLVIRLGVGFYFAVFTLSLPGAYGVLLHKPVYPPALIKGEHLRTEGYLLSQTGDSVLLWYPTAKTVAWLPIGRAESIQTGRPRNIFT